MLTFMTGNGYSLYQTCHGQLRIFNSFLLHGFRLWEETGALQRVIHADVAKTCCKANVFPTYCAASALKCK